jgi:CubicO group peptidase (beta-lactamase class C family)
LFERIEGRSLRRFVAEEICGRRGFDISIGLAAAEEGRRAELIAPPDMSSAQVGSFTPVQIAALANPALDPMLPNDPAWRAADLPSANGHANAHSLARLYAALIRGELVGGDALTEATTPRIENVDLVLGLPVRWGAGFLLNSDGVYGPGAATFGHSGWGGSFAMADPAAGLAMSYTMNRMGTLLRDDPRAVALIGAVYEALAG